jgi:GT2 family glycosyltransferase
MKACTILPSVLPQKIFLGIPVLNRLDLLERCLARVDVPAEILIVNNNTTERHFGPGLAALAAAHSLRVVEPGRNLGVAASWNLILRTAADSGHDVAFIGSNDTLLKPGTLAAVWERIEDSSPDELIWHAHSWNFFAVHTGVVSRVGWFDENFYPAYKEDQDYSYRCRLAGVKRVGLFLPRLEPEHLGSQTIRSDPEYGAQNDHTHHFWNRPYYLRKWGGDAAEERFTAPFDRPDRDWRWWPDPGGSLASRDWDRDRR